MKDYIIILKKKLMHLYQLIAKHKIKEVRKSSNSLGKKPKYIFNEVSQEIRLWTLCFIINKINIKFM